MDSSSFLSEETVSSERRVGFSKPDVRPDDHPVIGRSVASSPLERKLVPVEYQLVKPLEDRWSFVMHDQKVNNSLDWHSVGAERVSASTLLRPVDPSIPRSSVNKLPASYFGDGGRVDMMASNYEKSLFSSSFSELFSRKLTLYSNHVPYGHSVGTVASHFEEEEPFESLEDIEAQTIGNLLPNDDDLFTGVTDGLEKSKHTPDRDDTEELDFFSSVGGLDLGDDGSTAHIDAEFPGGVSIDQSGLCNGSVAGEHPYDEHPSRTLFVRNINSNVEDSELRALFEQHGEIRTLYTACKHRGFVMISYYDIRAARNAMNGLQGKPLRRRKLDIHYSIPKDNLSEKDINQGAVVVFNVDGSLSNAELHHSFGVFGEIKEIRESLQKCHHKCIEFFDVRAAEAALRALSRSDIAGKQIKLDPSRPGGSRQSLLQQIPPEFETDDSASYAQQTSPPKSSTAGLSGAVPHGAVDNGTFLGLPSALQAPFLESSFHHEMSSSVPNSFSSLMRMEAPGNQSGLTDPGHSQGSSKFNIRNPPSFYPHSFPEHPDGLNNSIHACSPRALVANINSKVVERIDNAQLNRVGSTGHPIEFNEGVFGSAGNGGRSLHGNHYGVGNTFYPQPPAMLWPNSPSFGNGISVAHPTARLHGSLRAPPPMLNPVLPINNHHVGSAPTANPSLWDRRHAYAGESPETSGFHPASLGNMGMSNNPLHRMEYVAQTIFPHLGGNNMEMPGPQKNVGLQTHHQRSMMFPSRGQMIPAMNSFDPPFERARSRRNEGSINQADKKQFELDIERILRGEDNRTTLMIKNIPNKYTSKMLLAAIDERHRGTYDFIYLPIDFKNKCNVGYAFINMTIPGHIIPFYQTFNGKKWEKFNSEKVASLAYARIQGKAALIAHFQNSSLMNEDKRCRPILFHTEGPNAGDQVPFPVGINVRTRPGKSRNITHHEENGEDNSNGDASSGKESD